MLRKKKPQKKHQLIATAFDKKGNAIGTGINDYTKSHPLMKLYADKSKDFPEKIFKHAELAAVLQAGDKEIYSMLVQRFDSKGHAVLAKPCKTCEYMLRDFGIKFVQYTSAEGIIKEEYT